MDRVCIEGLAADCVVGVYPRERVVSQPLRLDIEMRLDLERAGVEERVRHTIDYDFMSAQIVFILETTRFRMLETAALAVARYLLAPPDPGGSRPQIDEVVVRIVKPNALVGRALPSIEITRDKAWCKLAVEQKDFGTVDVIHETEYAGIYRLNIRPGGTIPLHIHEVMDEAELVLSAGLLCQGEPAAQGSVRRWPKGVRHRYDNPTDRWQSILCVDAPRFRESDEIVVEGAPDPIEVEHYWSGAS